MGPNDDVNLKIIDLGENDLSEVNPELIAGALLELETAFFYGTDMTTEQVQAFFSALDKNCRLKNLDIGSADLSGVEPELIAHTVAKLEHSDMSASTMTSEQVNSLLKQILVEPSLKTLRIDWVEDVDQELVTKAEKIIDNFIIYKIDDPYLDYYEDEDEG